MRQPTRVIAVVAVILAGLVLTACSDDDSPTSRGAPSSESTGSAEPSDPTEPAPGQEPAERGPADGVTVPEVLSGRAPLLEIYTDFQCPSCRGLATTYVEDLAAAAEAGNLNLVFHHYSFLDRASLNEYSSRAANAALCVYDAAGSEAYVAYFLALFEDQPAEGTAGPEDNELIDLAESVGAADVDECITQRQNADDVGAEADAARANGVTGTPTVYLDGVPIESAQWPEVLAGWAG